MRFLILVFLVSIFGGELKAQKSNGFGGGEYKERKRVACLDSDKRIGIKARLKPMIKKFRDRESNSSDETKSISYFTLPIKQSESLPYLNAYSISNFVDHDSSSDIMDYDCYKRAYDGHLGTDFSTWPFPWYLYNNDYIDVVAAAPGTIIEKADGNFDMNCECEGNWNAVYLIHDDGTTAWYGHLKLNSLTDKAVGESVERGEFLGKLASSGCSTGPHLHFEVYDTEGELIDPFAGECNDLNSESYWQDQGDYWVPRLNTISTHAYEAVFGCPATEEDPAFKNVFIPGEMIYFYGFFRDYLRTTNSQWRIIDPNGIVYDTWEHTPPLTYAFSFWYWYFELPFDAVEGEWTFEVEYQGEKMTHNFTYGETSSTNNPESLNYYVYPNPSQETISIDNLSAEAGKVTLINVDGATLAISINDANSIDVSDINPGVYLIQYEDTQGNLVTEKIIVQ